MKKQLLILGVISSFLLTACGDNQSQNENNLESIKDMSDSELKDFNKDKTKTVNQLNISKEQTKNYKKEYDKLTSQQQIVIDSLKFDKNKYYQVMNFNKVINMDYNFIIFMKSTEKSKELYQYSIDQLAKDAISQKILVYTDKPDDFKDLQLNSNITIKNLNDIDSQLNQLQVDESPSFFALKDNKVIMNLVGYYDYHSLKMNLLKFGGKI